MQNSGNASYAAAINRNVATQVELVEFSDWNNKRRETCGDNVVCGDPPAVDILDSVFIDFHCFVKDYMMANHGLLAHSEAFDLHASIAPHLIEESHDGGGMSDTDAF